MHNARPCLGRSFGSLAERYCWADNRLANASSRFQELRKKSVTLQLLWYEYKQGNPEGYQYSQFCNRYRQWAKKLDITLRQGHRAGEKMFVDYAGQTVPIINPCTEEVTKAQATPGRENKKVAAEGFESTTRGL